MSTKKVVLIVTGVLIAALLVAGIATASTLADDGKPGRGGKLLDRVAQILKIDRQTLANAFQQAGGELRQTRITTAFDKWVADGKLTQAQANQYKAWLAAKPAGVFGPFARPNVMDKLLKDGKITQAQYDTWKPWWNQKPAFDLPKPDKPVGAGPRGGPNKP
jgi:hypothetical protein